MIRTSPFSVAGRVSRENKARARKVRLLLMDVDGVLTDGRIYYVPAGGGAIRGRRLALVETKTFHSRDGLGIRFAQQAGLRLGLLSGRRSLVVEHRARELDIDFVRQDAREKLEPYQEILREAGLRDEEVCYVGDDLVDLPVLVRVGLAVGVGDGHPLLARYVHYITRAPGGGGAVRETIELILAAQGKFEPILRRYLGSARR